MQDIIVTVGGSNAKRRRLVEKAAYFCTERLKLKKAAIDIEIVRSKLEEDDLDLVGYCCYDGKTYGRHFFEIVLSGRVCDAELLTTLFHELKHTEQFATGLLSRDVKMWRGKDYSQSNVYASAPWEVSARRFEERMMNRWYMSDEWN